MEIQNKILEHISDWKGNMMETSKKFLKELNSAYIQLETKFTGLLRELKQNQWETESGWYNGHYHKDGQGAWQREAYPIPVISVKNLCDIEISFHKIFVTAKLKRETACEYSYEKFRQFSFEAYGVEDYLSDYYHEGLSLQDLKENIRNSTEKEIGFQFFFPFDIFDIQKDWLQEFLKLLMQKGFYY